MLKTPDVEPDLVISPHKVVRLSAARRVIARRMVESVRESPHFYVSVDVDMTSVIQARKRMKTGSEGCPSINDFFLWAIASALTKYPTLNSSLKGDHLTIFEDSNLGLVISSNEKIFVPVICKAQLLNLHEISEKSRLLAEKAKLNGFQPADFENSTFCVSNLGMYGVDRFTAIINPGQTAILAIGEVAQKAWVIGEEIQIRHMSAITLSVDHRVADGVLAAKFVKCVKETLQNHELPDSMVKS